MMIFSPIDTIVFSGPLPLPEPPAPPTDLNQLDEGVAYHRTKVYLGPTLGWIESVVNPLQVISTAGTTDLGPATSVVLVSVASPVTLNLPDVRTWIREPHYQPYTGFGRSIWIKDFGGFSATNNITIVPFPGQFIDNQSSIILAETHGMKRFYPLNDLVGWFSG